MGLFNNFKDKVNEEKQKQAALTVTRGNKLGSIPAEYSGGYGSYKKSKGILTFYQNQTEFKNILSRNNSFTIINTNIADVQFEGKDDVFQQRTITRNLLLAGKSKKEEIKDTYIVISLTNNQEALFHVTDKSPMEVRAKLANAVSTVKQSHVSTPTPTVSHGSLADELTKLARLKQQGFITQEEFDKKKAQLMA